MKIKELSIYEELALNKFSESLTSTFNKFFDNENYIGYIESLKMIKDFPENNILEQSYFKSKDIQTTCYDDIKAIIEAWNQYQNYRTIKYNTLQKNNCKIKINNEEVEVSYFELIEIENHIKAIKTLVEKCPTIDDSIEWNESTSRENLYIQSKPFVTPKIDENDKTIIGSVTKVIFNGSLTKQKKKELLDKLNALIIQIQLSLIEKDSIKVNNTNSLTQKILTYLFGD